MRSYSLRDATGVSLDSKLDALFNKQQGGFFIELGAHNGITQSNTAFLEFTRGWKGVLIEPSPEQYRACVKNRPNSTCFHSACVSNAYTSPTIRGDFVGHLMSSVDGLRGKNTDLVTVPANTLTSILDKVPGIETIDLLSLDTEGYELDILKGLDLTRYRPRYMLIEVYTAEYDILVEFLQQNDYVLVCNFSNYNHTLHPGWDGTHNDYLFKDSRA